MLRLTLLALVLAVQVTYSAPQPQPKIITVEGNLVFVDLHDSGVQWAIRGQDGILYPLAKTLPLPSEDINGRPLEPGALVSLDCKIDAAGACTSALSSDFTVIAANAVSLVIGANITHSTLAMIIDFSACGYPPSLNESAVRTIYLGPNQDGRDGVAQKFNQCSYGLLNINATTFTAVKIAPTCSTSTITSCSWYSLAFDADTAAGTALGATVFADFTNYVYILPPGMQNICGWAGVALLPGKQIWLQTSAYGIERWATVMQESIHNYGLWHSWQGGIEYNDFSTAMGRGDACPNAAEISRMGWATPAAGGSALNLTTLAPGVSRTFNLPATYLTGTGNYLRVLPNWMPNYNVTSVGKNLYIAVRVAKGADAGLQASYAGQINIHEVNAMADNGYPTSYIYYDRRISFISTTLPLSRTVLSSYNLVVYGGSWADTDILRVHLCRYMTSDTECPGLNVLETPPPRPPPPKPPSPQAPQQPPPKRIPSNPPSRTPAPKPPKPPSPPPPPRPPPKPRSPPKPPAPPRPPPAPPSPPKPPPVPPRPPFPPPNPPGVFSEIPNPPNGPGDSFPPSEDVNHYPPPPDPSPDDGDWKRPRWPDRPLPSFPTLRPRDPKSYKQPASPLAPPWSRPPSRLPSKPPSRPPSRPLRTPLSPRPPSPRPPNTPPPPRPQNKPPSPRPPNTPTPPRPPSPKFPSPNLRSPPPPASPTASSRKPPSSKPQSPKAPTPWPPSPSPSMSTKCPAEDLKCSQCIELVAVWPSPVRSALELECAKCGGNVKSFQSCKTCFSPVQSVDVLLSCLYCAGNEDCSRQCGPVPQDAKANCVDCNKKSGDCGTCLGSSNGVAAKLNSCFGCVAQNLDSSACSKCTSMYGSSCEVDQCMSCLSKAGGNEDAYKSCYKSSFNFKAVCGLQASG